jgi:hypothetical protein
MSHLSRMKNPGLPYLSVTVALQAYGYILSSLDVQTPWEPLLPLPGHTVLAERLIAVLLFPISWPSPVCYLLFDHCHIRHASPPKAYRRRKGDSSINYHYTTRRAVNH